MRDFLIYGASTPLGARLCWYLSEYGKQRDIHVNLRPVAQGPSHMGEIQEDVWGQMIGSRANRPDCIVNCHVPSPKVAESNHSLAWQQCTTVPTMLALAARSAGIPFVQISTDRVFSGRSGPYSTEDRPGPADLFGAAMMFGEQFAQRIHPPKGDEVSGSFVVRISSLYGYDVHNDVRVGMLSGGGTTMASAIMESPSFVGEVAFLLARNLLESPMSLNRAGGAPIHLAPKADNTSMFLLLSAAGIRVETRTEYDVRSEHTMSFGLTPTPGWVLSSGRAGVWRDFCEEMESGQYMRYW